MNARFLWTGFMSAVAILAVVVSGTKVQAQDTFAANDGDWSDPLNWNNGVPASGVWAAINDGYTIDVTPGAVVGLLDVGATGTGNLSIAAGADLTADAFRVGQAGGAIGNVTMTGGSVSANGALDGPFLQGDILIGDAGTGTWTIADGTLTAQDEFLVGFINNADGTLDVGGGTVNVGRNLIIGVLGNGTGALNVSGGVVNVDRDFLSSLNAGTSSTLTQSGGTINVGQHFILGVAEPSSYTQTGGDVHVNGVDGRLTVAEGNTANWDLMDGSITSTHIFLGDFDNSHGTMEVSGGSISLSGNLNVGAALASNAASFPPGNALNADGTLIVSGSGGSIDVDGDLLANPDDNPRGENDANLLFEVLDSSGVSTIDVAGVADLTGAVIDFDLLGGSFTNGDFFDLITASSISNDYVQAAADVGSIGLSIVSGGNGQILRATLVPEPATCALAIFAALGLVVRRQKFSLVSPLG